MELGNTGAQLMSGDPLGLYFTLPVLMTYLALYVTYLALNLRVPIVLPGLWLHLWIYLLFVDFLQNSCFLEPPHSYFLSIETTPKRLFLSASAFDSRENPEWLNFGYMSNAWS